MPKRLCPLCGFESRGLGYRDPRDKKAERIWFCSKEHMEAWLISPTPAEQQAAHEAGIAGGQYLDSIGKTDLATLSRDEYALYVQTIIVSFKQRVADLAAECPF